MAFEFDEWIEEAVSAYDSEDHMTVITSCLIAIAYLLNEISKAPEEQLDESTAGPCLDFGDGSAGS